MTIQIVSLLQHTAVLCDALTLDSGSFSYTPDNGPPFMVSTVAVPSCDEGFTLNGSVARICEDDGAINVGFWSGEQVQCNGIYVYLYIARYKI